jgi:hypothetical protein
MLPEETSSDYQQDFLVDGKVKLSFFTADASLTQLLKPEDSNTIRIASLEELFASKALVCAIRSTDTNTPWRKSKTVLKITSRCIEDVWNFLIQSFSGQVGL